MTGMVTVMKFKESLDVEENDTFQQKEQLLDKAAPKINTYLDKITSGLVDMLDKQGIQINQHVGDAREGAEVIGMKVVFERPTEEQQQKINEAARIHYLKKLRSRCRHLPLASIGAIEGDADDITLKDVYIGLNTDRPMDQEKAGKSTGRRERKLPAIEAFRRHPRLMLLGDPGSGKSSFVKEVIASYIDALLGEEDELPANLPHGLIPVRIILRNLALSIRTVFPEGITDERDHHTLARIIRRRALDDLVLLEATEFSEQLHNAFEQNSVFLVLDGLDEVPTRQRLDIQRVVSALVKVYNLEYMIITCRVRSYDNEAQIISNCKVFRLADFDDSQKESFTTAWYKTLAPRLMLTTDEQQKKATDLKDASTSEELTELAGNPMLLTTIALIHQRDTILPDKRVELYQEAVDVMLHKWQRRKGLDELGVSVELEKVLKDNHLIQESLMRLAYEAHLEHSADPDFEGIKRGAALTLLDSPQYFGSIDLADQFLDYVDQRSGLLQGQGGAKNTKKPATYGFPHRTFQEYLAGRYLASFEFDEHLKRLAKERDFWYEAISFGLEDQIYLRGGRRSMLKMAYLLRPSRFPRKIAGQRLLLWLGYLVELAGSDFVHADTSSDRGGKVFLRKIKNQLTQLLGKKLPAIERAEAGRILGSIGDPRKEVTIIEHMKFCCVPAGAFQMGSNNGEGISFNDERPRRVVDIPYEYWIGRFPVTQAQFNACLLMLEAMIKQGRIGQNLVGLLENDEKWSRPLRL